MNNIPLQEVKNRIHATTYKPIDKVGIKLYYADNITFGGFYYGISRTE